MPLVEPVVVLLRAGSLRDCRGVSNGDMAAATPTASRCAGAMLLRTRRVPQSASEACLTRAVRAAALALPCLARMPTSTSAPAAAHV